MKRRVLLLLAGALLLFAACSGAASEEFGFLLLRVGDTDIRVSEMAFIFGLLAIGGTWR